MREKLGTAKEEAQIQFNSYKLFKSEAFMEHSLSLDNTNAQSVIAYLKYLIENNQRKMLTKKYLYLILSEEQRKKLNQLYLFTNLEIKDYKKEIVSFLEKIKRIINQTDKNRWKDNFSNIINTLNVNLIPKNLFNNPFDITNENHFYLSLLNYISTESDAMIYNYQFASKAFSLALDYINDNTIENKNIYIWIIIGTINTERTSLEQELFLSHYEKELKNQTLTFTNANNRKDLITGLHILNNTPSLDFFNFHKSFLFELLSQILDSVAVHEIITSIYDYKIDNEII